MTGPLRILLVDDHAAVRQAVTLLINSLPDMKVICEAGDGVTAVQQAQELKPDVVVMDLSMPQMSGLVAVRTLKKLESGPAIVIWSRHDDDAHVQELLGAGASSYVSKSSALDELLHGIRAAAAGGRYVDSTITGRQLRASGERSSSTPRTLNEWELEVLRMAAMGYANKDIAAKLGLSVKTIEAHKANAFRKLGFVGRVALMRYAALQGWLHDA
jgi:two-component system response regulator NreC